MEMVHEFIFTSENEYFKIKVSRVMKQVGFSDQSFCKLFAAEDRSSHCRQNPTMNQR